MGHFEPYMTGGFSSNDSTSVWGIGLGLKFNFLKGFKKNAFVPFANIRLVYSSMELETITEDLGSIELDGNGFLATLGIGAQYFLSSQAALILSFSYNRSFSFDLDYELEDIDLTLSGFGGAVGLSVYF